MKKKVRITKAPRVNKGRDNTGRGMSPMNTYSDILSTPDLEHNKTLKPVDPQDATIEAEKGEFIVTTSLDGGIPETYTVGGKKHSNGGTPLDVPPGAFIFSNSKDLVIDDLELLGEFGIKKKKKWTFADIAKKYDVNDHRQMLVNKNSSKREVETSETMIRNKMNKLGKLALVQESQKNFKNGIPEIANAYLVNVGLTPEDILPKEAQQQGGPEMEQESFKKGGETGKAARIQKRKGKYPKRWAKFFQREMQRYAQGKTTRLPWTITHHAGNSSNSGKTISTNNDFSFITDDMVKSREEAGIGDYIKTDDGGFQRKKSQGGYNLDIKYKSGDKYEPQKGSLEDDIKYVESLFNKKVNGKPIAYKGKNKKGQFGWIIQPEAAEALSFEDKELITILSSTNASGNLGAGDFKIVSQNTRGGKGGFAGFVDSEWTEYIHWKNRNPDGTSDQFSKLSSEEKIENKKDQYRFLGLDKKGWDLDKMDLSKPLTVEQQKQHAAAMQSVVPEGKGRAIHKTDGLGGLETYDFYNYNKTEDEYEDVKPDAAKGPLADDFDSHSLVGNDDFFIQDIINTTGAFMDKQRINKHLPWSAPYIPITPEATFFDPTRALAANAEQAAIASDAAAKFSGPQALGARSSAIEGQSMANAANILSDVNNKNVGVSNQFAGANADILNQANQFNALRVTQDFDKTTIANQQYDNEQAQAREQIRGAVTNAFTNRATANNIDALNPQFTIDKLSGGNINFLPGAGKELYAGAKAQTPSEIGELAATLAGQYDGSVLEWFKELNSSSSKKKKKDKFSDSVDLIEQVFRGSGINRS